MANYTEKSLDILHSVSLLSREDIEIIKDLKNELEHGFHKGQIYRTFYEAEHSVLVDAKFPTADSKYWQSIREQQVHFSELVSLSFEYQKTMIRKDQKIVQKLKLEKKLKEFSDKLDISECNLKIKRIEVDINRLGWIAEQQKRMAKDRVREVKQWSKIKKKWEHKLEYGKEDCGAHQHKSYLLRFVNQTNLVKAGNTAMSGPETINLLSQLIDAMKVPENAETVRRMLGGGDPTITQFMGSGFKKIK